MRGFPAIHNKLGSGEICKLWRRHRYSETSNLLRGRHSVCNRYVRFIDKRLIRADPGSSRLVAQILWTSMHGLAALLLARPRPHFSWDDTNQLIETQVRVLALGVASRS